MLESEDEGIISVPPKKKKKARTVIATALCVETVGSGRDCGIVE